MLPEGGITLISENIITNEEILRELNGISPSKIATGLLNLERMLKNLKNKTETLRNLIP